jgi:membrane protease YdiL (CAAX protease family)
MKSHMGQGLRRWCWEFVAEPLRRADADALANPQKGIDKKTLTILLSAAFLLTVQRYLFYTDELDRTAELLRGLALPTWADRLESLQGLKTLPALAWWATGTFACWFIAPALIVVFLFREPLSAYGFKLRGSFADGWVYLVMLAVMIPIVYFLSRTSEFQKTYPFLRPRPATLGWDFWRWEALYALQFIAVEFFFRGFLVHGLKHRFGAYAIPVMVIPYCMIHFGKPLPETVAAIVAGLVLGFMSLRTSSIALGFAMHVSVALGMDVASMWRAGAFG